MIIDDIQKIGISGWETYGESLMGAENLKIIQLFLPFIVQNGLKQKPTITYPYPPKTMSLVARILH